MPDVTDYRIELNGRWFLTEFYDFSHVYDQVYSTLAALQYYPESSRDLETIHRTFATYPWQGGFSAVNFFRVLHSNLPRDARPKVHAIRYSSPGYMQLLLWIATAEAVRRLVNACSDSAERIHGVYDRIYRGMQERKLLRMDVRERELKLSQAETQFVRQSITDLESAMTFEFTDELRTLTPIHLMRLKILMSLLRRVQKLMDFVADGKVRF